MSPRDQNFTYWFCSLRLTHQSAKWGGKKPCWSEDVIYFNHDYREKDTYDYLIRKCDNSVLQALITYCILQSEAK